MSSKVVADKLDNLARALLEDALSAQPPEGLNRLEVFKAVAQYHASSSRAERGQSADSLEGGSFKDLKDQLGSLSERN